VPLPAGEEYHEWLPVDLQTASGVDFALWVAGNSMNGAGIPDGSLVLIKQTEEEPRTAGDIVAVEVGPEGDAATLKRFYRQADHVLLRPANDAYPLLILKPGNVPAEKLRKHYKQTFPDQEVVVYSSTAPLIRGWCVGVISETEARTRLVTPERAG
jgi:hypothetical protein